MRPLQPREGLVVQDPVLLPMCPSHLLLGASSHHHSTSLKNGERSHHHSTSLKSGLQLLELSDKDLKQFCVSDGSLRPAANSPSKGKRGESAEPPISVRRNWPRGATRSAKAPRNRTSIRPATLPFEAHGISWLELSADRSAWDSGLQRHRASSRAPRAARAGGGPSVAAPGTSGDHVSLRPGPSGIQMSVRPSPRGTSFLIGMHSKSDSPSRSWAAHLEEEARQVL
ncbi:uncharacterized protein LOC129051651 [Pongo abelii]|uniref:uncharacterized protein LOC129051651 n=1 Tax=Pongo abelii TaxID=9601 RepID=UPI0030070096